MSRLHDMGGRFGDGAVDPTDDATFAKDWHARALALTLAAGALGQWNIDIGRHARERLSPGSQKDTGVRRDQVDSFFQPIHPMPAIIVRRGPTGPLQDQMWQTKALRNRRGRRRHWLC